MPIDELPARFEHNRGATARLLDVQCTAGRSTRTFEERHDSYCIAFVRRGTFHYRGTADTRGRDLYPGWLLLCRYGHNFHCTHAHDGGDECTVLELSPSVLEQVATKIPRCRDNYFPRATIAPIPRVTALMQHAFHNGTQDHPLDELAFAIVATTLSALWDGNLEPEEKTRGDRERVRAAVMLLEEKYHQTWSLAALSREVGLTEFHFLRLFKAEFGVTPHQYLVGARLRAASDALVRTARPVTEIALDVGFQDLSNFVRTFHREIGCSPRVFRKTGGMP